MTDTVLGIQVGERQILPVFNLARPERATRYFTTLADNQPKALFHFYLKDNKAEARWLSVGSVFLEKLSPAPAGQPTFELRLSPKISGDVLLELRDRSSGNRKRLLFPASQLKAGIPPVSRSQLTDREPSAGKRARRGQSRDSTIRLAERPGRQRRQPQRREKPRRILLAVAVFVSALLVVVVFLLLTARLTLPPVIRQLLGPSGVDRQQAARHEPAEAGSGYSPEEVEQVSPEGPPSDARKGGQSTDEGDTQLDRNHGLSSTGTGSVAEAVPSGDEETAGATEDQSDVGQGGESLPYLIHWGDTLWQITERYYGDADLYPLLAGKNGISNPHLLVAGTEIRLPPKIDDEERKDSE